MELTEHDNLTAERASKKQNHDLKQDKKFLNGVKDTAWKPPSTTTQGLTMKKSHGIAV